MATHIINGIKIHTTFEYPPIPVRDMDWSAVTDDYDVDCDQDGYFSNSPQGRGATEQEAIDDLLSQIADDDVGPHLECLSQAVTELQKLPVARLYGDRGLIAGGIQGLRVVLDRIEDLQAREPAIIANNKECAT